MTDWRLVVVTTYFPNSSDPQRAVFVKNLLAAMKGIAPPIVISPIPWVPPWLRGAAKRALRAVPRQASVGDIEVLHPRYFVFPKLDGLSGLTFALSIVGQLRWLRRAYKKIVVHAHCAYPDGVGVALACQWLGLDFVLTAHGSDINVYAQRPMIRWQVASALRRAKTAIGVSDALCNKMREIGGAGVDIRNIPCAGYDERLFLPKEKGVARAVLARRQSGRIVLFIGNLFSIKAVDVLIDAWAAHRAGTRWREGDRLVIVGDGPLLKDLVDQVVSRNLVTDVEFVGAVPYERIPDWINAANVLCLPSRNEGMPNVIVEALACGIPVVATNVGGIPELLAGTGLPMVTPGDSDALALALGVVLDDSVDASRLRDRVVAHTWPALAKRNLQVLQRVAGGEA